MDSRAGMRYHDGGWADRRTGPPRTPECQGARIVLHQGFRIDDHLPAALLILLFRDPDQPEKKRWAACMALGGKTDDASFEALCQGLDAPEWEIRHLSIEALRRRPLNERAHRAIARALFDVNDQVRQTACKVCGELGLDSARGGVRQLLQADNPDVRDVAVNALSKLWRPEDYDPVFDRYRNDPVRAVRIAAAKVLRRHATAKDWRPLFAHWASDREVRHRIWGCELAARFGGRADRAKLDPLRHDRNQNVRTAAEGAAATLERRCV